MADVLPASYSVFHLVAEVGCSCGLYYEEDDEVTRRGAVELEAEKRASRYRKRGWSEAKVRRAVADHLLGRERAEGGRREAELESIRKVEQSLTEIARHSKHGVYVLVHQYDGPVAGTRFRTTLLSRESPHVHLGAPSLPLDVIVRCGAR